MFVKVWAELRETSKGWCRGVCLTTKGLCQPKLEGARRQNRDFTRAPTEFEGCLTGSMTFSRKSQTNCRGRKNRAARRKGNKHDDLTLNAPDWLHSIESQREKEPIHDQPPRAQSLVKKRVEL